MKDLWNTMISNPTMKNVIIAIIGIAMISILIRLLQRFASNTIKNNDARYRVRKGLAFFSYVLIILFTIGVFSDHLGNFVVAFGVASAGIAFALQEVIVSLAGWIALSFSQFYHVGDRVQVGGIKGDVIDIGVLRTTLMEIGQWVDGDLYNGRIVKVANSFVFKEPVFNYSADFPFVWDELTVPIKYGSDYIQARNIITQSVTQRVSEYTSFAKKTWEKMIRKFSIEEASVEPQITMVANDNWMEFTARYVVDYKKRRSTKDQIFSEIVTTIEKTDGKVGIASATFHLVEAPRFDVKLDPSSKAGK